jgi:hypothetical protein
VPNRRHLLCLMARVDRPDQVERRSPLLADTLPTNGCISSSCAGLCVRIRSWCRPAWPTRLVQSIDFRVSPRISLRRIPVFSATRTNDRRYGDFDSSHAASRSSISSRFKNLVRPDGSRKGFSPASWFALRYSQRTARESMCLRTVISRLIVLAAECCAIRFET